MPSAGSLLGASALGRRREAERHDLLFRIGRIDGRAGRGAVDALMAIRAAIEPRHVAEIVVDRELGEARSGRSSWEQKASMIGKPITSFMTLVSRS